MSVSPIVTLLGIARTLRLGVQQIGPSHNVVALLQTQTELRPDTPAFYTAMAETLDVCNRAEFVIKADERMDDEGKSGLIQQISALRQLFSAGGCNAPLQSYIQNIDVLVSQFAIVAGFYTPVKDPFSNARSQIDDLLASIDALIGEAAVADTDEITRQILTEQLKALRFFLSNVQTFGFDAAYAAYVTLVIKLRRETKVSSGDFIAKAWGDVERWAGRLAIIEEIVSNSQSLIDVAEEVWKLLS